MDESQFKALRELAKDGRVSQRDLSRKIGLSLGRVNYLVKALLEKGYIKAKRFKNSKNKIGYMYVLTPKGISKRASLTYKYLQIKLDEYERLKRDIQSLRNEADDIENGNK